MTPIKGNPDPGKRSDAVHQAREATKRLAAILMGLQVRGKEGAAEEIESALFELESSVDSMGREEESEIEENGEGGMDVQVSLGERREGEMGMEQYALVVISAQDTSFKRQLFTSPTSAVIDLKSLIHESLPPGLQSIPIRIKVYVDIERLLSLAGKSTVDVGKIEFYGELVGIDGVEMVQVREGKNDGEEKVLNEIQASLHDPTCSAIYVAAHLSMSAYEHLSSNDQSSSLNKLRGLSEGAVWKYHETMMRTSYISRVGELLSVAEEGNREGGDGEVNGNGNGEGVDGVGSGSMNGMWNGNGNGKIGKKKQYVPLGMKRDENRETMGYELNKSGQGGTRAKDGRAWEWQGGKGVANGIRSGNASDTEATTTPGSAAIEAKPVSTWAQVAKTDVNGKILHIPTPARMTKAKKGPPGPLSPSQIVNLGAIVRAIASLDAETGRDFGFYLRKSVCAVLRPSVNPDSDGFNKLFAEAEEVGLIKCGGRGVKGDEKWVKLVPGAVKRVS